MTSFFKKRSKKILLMRLADGSDGLMVSDLVFDTNRPLFSKKNCFPFGAL
jgi:hypothetical protein